VLAVVRKGEEIVGVGAIKPARPRYAEGSLRRASTPSLPTCRNSGTSHATRFTVTTDFHRASSRHCWSDMAATDLGHDIVEHYDCCAIFIQQAEAQYAEWPLVA